MEIKQLEAFVCVVEKQSFSNAAKQLYLTQPTISAHVVSLEKELNAKLLERTTKRVKITKEGEVLYEYAKEILNLKEEVLEKFQNENKKEAKIVVSGSTIPSLHVFPELLPAFQREYPKVYFHTQQGDSQEVMKAVLSHKIDVGFVGMKEEDERLHFIPILEDKLVIITPNNAHYQKLLASGCSLNRLFQEPVILREQGSGTKKEGEKFLEYHGISIEKMSVVAHMNDQEMIKRSVSRGMGISIISKKSMEDYLELGKLLLYEPKESEMSRFLYMVFEKKKKFSKMEKTFIAFASSFYEKELEQKDHEDTSI